MHIYISISILNTFVSTPFQIQRLVWYYITKTRLQDQSYKFDLFDKPSIPYKD